MSRVRSKPSPSYTYVVLIISRLKRTNQLFAAPLKIFLLSYLATPTAFYFSSREGGTNRQNEQRASITRHSCQLSEYRRLRKLLAPENWNLFSIKLNENIPTDCARPTKTCKLYVKENDRSSQFVSFSILKILAKNLFYIFKFTKKHQKWVRKKC